MSTSADATYILANLPTSVTVTYGAASTTGPLVLRDVVEDDGSGGERVVKRYVLRIPAAALPLLAENANVTIASTTYRVRRMVYESTDVKLLTLVKV